ncbi:MAG: DUF4190 domain-containing protein [Saprospiraceae bacterium]|nr:DUF4190 domain-containing protein [Saprospiraceae bacterium]
MRKILFFVLVCFFQTIALAPAHAYSLELPSARKSQTTTIHSSSDGQGQKLKWKDRLLLKGLAKKSRTGNPSDDKVRPLTITGFILGIAGLLTIFWGVGGLLCLGAIICSAIALKRYKFSSNKKGKGLAIAGLVMGCVGVGLTITAFAVLLILLHYYV